MPQLITLYWRDIPAQVIAKQRRETEKIVLSERFALAIDAAAMRGGQGSDDAYMQAWRKVSVDCGDDLRAVAQAAAAHLEATYDSARLRALVHHRGHATEIAAP